MLEKTSLMRAKLYPLKSSVESCKCNRTRYQICTIVSETDIFTSTFTGKTYRINHELCCVDKCLIFLLTFNKCSIQYLGQAEVKFRSWWNNYNSDCRKHTHGETCFQEHMLEHSSPSLTRKRNKIVGVL